MFYEARLPAPRRQRGAVLFVALVFLVLLTLLAVAGMGTSILQERMTGGMRNSQLAQMGAETGLRAKKRKPALDQVAAQQILQQFFDSPAQSIAHDAPDEFSVNS